MHKQRLSKEQIKQLRCELCKDDNYGFIIYPTKDKRLIKWDCGHLLYKDEKLVFKHKK